MHIMDQSSGGIVTMMYSAIDLLDSCPGSMEDEHYPDSGELILRVEGVLEGMQDSMAEGTVPSVIFVDSEGFTVHGKHNINCETADNAASSPFTSVTPGEKIRIEQFRSVPSNVEKMKVEHRLYDLTS